MGIVKIHKTKAEAEKFARAFKKKKGKNWFIVVQRSTVPVWVTNHGRQ